jgi:pimeloyl-ACP methyl ester carboxylesterase
MTSEWDHGYGPGAGGARLHYVRGGRGRPVLLLHGWPGYWYDWRRVLPELMREADAIAPDLRGFGDSDGPAGDTTNEQELVADMVVLLDHLEVERAVVAGHDIGSAVAQGLARSHPERVAALALFDPTHPGIGDRRNTPSMQPELWYQHFHLLSRADRLISHDRQTVELYLRHFYDHWVGVKGSVEPGELAAIVDVYARPGALARSIAWYRGRPAERRRQAAQDPAGLVIHKPTIVRWGELDPVIPAAWSDRIGEFFSDLDLELLPGVGHFVPFEAPEAALGAIRKAVARGAW